MLCQRTCAHFRWNTLQITSVIYSDLQCAICVEKHAVICRVFGAMMLEDVGRLWHYRMETPNPQKILPGRACNLYRMETPNPWRNHSFLDVVKLRLYTGGWGFPFYSKKLAIFFILRLGSRVRWGLPFYSDGGFCSKFVAVNICFFKWISYFIEVHLFCDPGCFHFIEVPFWGWVGAPVLVL